MDIFVGSAIDMPGVSPDVITHRLNMDPMYHPMKKKKRNFVSDSSRSIDEEVTKLLEANFIREVYYVELFANVVLVKKASGKW